MITLIDTSVWIEFFRAKGEPVMKSRVTDLLTLGHAAYTCPIRFELFLGARTTEQSDLLEGLNFAKRLPLAPHHWDAASDHGATLRGGGITLPVSDLLIAAVALDRKVPLLTRDEHFHRIKKEILPSLQLV